MNGLKLFAKDENQLNSLFHMIRRFPVDIRMEFGLWRCATLVMKRGKLVTTQRKEMLKAIELEIASYES